MLAYCDMIVRTSSLIQRSSWTRGTPLARLLRVRTLLLKLNRPYLTFAVVTDEFPLGTLES